MHWESQSAAERERPWALPLQLYQSMNLSSLPGRDPPGAQERQREPPLAVRHVQPVEGWEHQEVAVEGKAVEEKAVAEEPSVEEQVAEKAATEEAPVKEAAIAEPVAEEAPVEEAAAPAEEEEKAEEDGLLEDRTKKELANNCKALGPSDKGTKTVPTSRIKEAKASPIEEALSRES